jgi:hypothetical protein
VNGDTIKIGKKEGRDRINVPATLKNGSRNARAHIVCPDSLSKSPREISYLCRMVLVRSLPLAKMFHVPKLATVSPLTASCTRSAVHLSLSIVHAALASLRVGYEPNMLHENRPILLPASISYIG